MHACSLSLSHERDTIIDSYNNHYDYAEASGRIGSVSCLVAMHIVYIRHLFQVCRIADAVHTCIPVTKVFIFIEVSDCHVFI